MAQQFISEFGLNMVANGSVLLQDEHLERLSTLLGPDAPRFHIYFIGSRPRIGIDPARFTSSEDRIAGVFLVHQGDARTEVPFECPHPPQGRVTRVEAPWPHTSFKFLNGDTQIVTGKVALFASMFPQMREHLDLEVLYVGQAFGDEGERQAADRLGSHSTLQRILSEASRLQPDREIWLGLFHFEEMILASFDGRLAQSAEAVEADEGRIERVLSQEVSEQQRINFTEAALIRYFEPRFNKTFRATFPSATHTSYAECYAIDLNMVSVELDTDDLHTRFHSASVPAMWRHFAMFPLHDRSERRYMLDLLRANPADR